MNDAAKNTASPSVSVCMPCYNAAPYIMECIESVLAQSFTDFELIAVDDGSTDNTVDVIRKIADQRLRYFTLPHSNANVARNYALSQSKGKYVAFLDADDIWQPCHLADCLRTLQQHEADGLYGGIAVGANVVTVRSPTQSETMIDYLLKTGYGAQTSTLFMAADSVRDIGWDEELNRHQDYDFVVRYAKKYKLIPKPAATVAYNTSRQRVVRVDFGSCIKFIERNRNDISPEVYKSYSKSMLRLAQAQNADKNVIEHYRSAVGQQLTIIIPFLNEGEEVERTVASIRETSVANPCIVLINDASNDGYDYKSVAEKYGCRYVKNDERLGVAESRNLGVRESSTPYFLLLDGHMRFYEHGWDERLVRLLDENPRSVLCGQTKWLEKDENGSVVEVEYSRQPLGAYIDMSTSEALKAKWNPVDMAPYANLMEIPCILGAAYACSKTYWEQLKGLEGLLLYGMDEQLLSIKVWLEGGQCLLVKDWVVAHIYRKNAPYKIENIEFFYNKLFLLELLFPYSIKKDFFDYAQKARRDTFAIAYAMLRERHAAIKAQQKYLHSIFENGIGYFLALNEKFGAANDAQR